MEQTYLSFVNFSKLLSTRWHYTRIVSLSFFFFFEKRNNLAARIVYFRPKIINGHVSSLAKNFYPTKVTTTTTTTIDRSPFEKKKKKEREMRLVEVKEKTWRVLLLLFVRRRRRRRLLIILLPIIYTFAEQSYIILHFGVCSRLFLYISYWHKLTNT